MSYWVYLNGEDKERVAVAPHIEGGTHVVGGTTEATLNITYNYDECYNLYKGFSIKDLDGKRAVLTVNLLTAVVLFLGTRRHSDYWAPTPGNAGHAASILLGWAKQHPDAKWRVS